MAGILDISAPLEYRSVPIEPPFIALKKKKIDFLNWFQKTLEVLEALSELRIQTHINNLLWYTGDYDKTFEYRTNIPGQSATTIPRRVLPRIFNHLYDLTEHRVSRLAALKPDFDAVPTNREENDRVVARLIKLSLQAMARRIHFDTLMQNTERWAAVFGEVLVSIEWNTKIGDRKARGSLDRVGDVDVQIKHPWTWLPKPCLKREDIDWGIDIWKIMQVEEARIVFKDKSIEPDGKTNVFSFNQDIQEKREDELVIYRLINKPTEFLPEGNITYIANGKELDRVTEYPYSHNEFPFEWHTDIDVPGRLFPMSAYHHIKPIQHLHNRMTSLVARNITLVGHPHIMMPRGSAKVEAFGNAPTAIEYNPGMPEPSIKTFPSVPKEMFDFRGMCRQEMEQIYGTQGVSRGAPPSGTRSNSMLNFFEEQERQRASSQIIKHNELIRSIYLKAGSVIGDYYPTSSKDRLIRVVGKDNQYLIEAFEGAKISSEYDIIIINSTGFSESKAGRIEEIGFLQQVAPGLLSREQIADILELGNTQKMYDITTSAIKQAEEENERFLNGKDVPPAQNYQDLITHWRTHMILFNTSTWEYHATKAMKEKAEEHMLRTERLMEEKAKNPAFSQELATLRGYPAFWVSTPSLPQEPEAPTVPSAVPMEEPLPMGMPMEGAPPEQIPAAQSQLLPQGLPPPEFLQGLQ